jgi:urease accessory protein
MIIAVSAWAALLPQRGRIVVALCLALFVGLGALLPVSAGPSLEAAIALSVVGAGTLLAIGKRWSMPATGLLAASFALIHGFAHGAEGPGRDGLYLAGLMLATFALASATSLVAGRLRERKAWLRFAGVLSAGAGAAALVG